MTTTETALRLRTIVTDESAKLLAVPRDGTGIPPRPGKWSAKQIIGHLIDSASNNHQRFVRAQFMDDLVFLGYEQEAWVALQGYADAEWSSLVTLWRELNLHIARIMERTPRETAEKLRRKHNLDQIAFETVSTDEAVTLASFMSDYVDHLQHHLKQVWSAVDAAGS